MADIDDIMSRIRAFNAWDDHRKSCPICIAHMECKEEDELFHKWKTEEE